MPGGRSFAVLARDGVSPRLVREGEAWGNLRLVRVEGDGVVVRTEAGTVSLQLRAGDR